MIRRRNLFWIALLTFCLFSVIITACGKEDSSASGQHTSHNSHETLVETASAKELPDFLSKYTPRTRELYAKADEHEELLKMLNCYCGCMDYAEDAHTSLYRCYIQGKQDGKITWTDHATQCGICTNEVKDAVDMKNKGMSNEDIVKAIDKAYKGI
ncbi:PCYCGC motif-containing (lipo)protein [Paenibacillus gansuensis]|uniref:PCYCGC motif-containing (Lipo)protein n=1 Tax=Paenibacillus gansuensis TaxID=306542 RepID=A0ABW5PE19_9BACL